MAAQLRIAVTGAQGYLGRKVVQCLARKGTQVIALGRKAGDDVRLCDLSEADQVGSTFAAINADRIVHCAAHIPTTLDEYGDAASAEKSLKMVEHVLDASRCPLVYISSMTVYGTGGSAAKREEEAGDPTSVYGIGKWEAEKLIERGGRPAWAVRIPGLFGEPRTGGLVRNVVRAFRDGAPLTLPEKPIVWAAMRVDDAAASIAQLALAEAEGFRPVNVAYRGVYSLSRLVKTAAELFGRQSSYVVEHPDFEFDLSLATRLGVVPENTLRDALVDLGKLP